MNQQHLMLLGAISQMPDEDRQQVTDCGNELREVLNRFSEQAQMLSLALIGLELQNEG